MIRRLLPLISGLLFGAGLALSGMTQPGKVIGFLNVAGDWDPSLALVMVGAIAVHAMAYRLVPHMPSPWLGGRFQLPTRRDLDARLIGGSAIFGVGWGLGGFCPGPALASLGTGQSEVFVVAGGMLAGALAHHVVDRTVLIDRTEPVAAK